MRSILCLLFIVGISCSGQKRVGSDNVAVANSDSTKLRLVMQELYSNVQIPIFQVITDENSLKKVFLQVNKTRKPGIPIPNIDFSKELLLFYGAGITEGGNNPELFVMEESRDSIRLGINNKHRSVQANLSIITTPMCLYALPATKKKIVFLDGINP